MFDRDESQRNWAVAAVVVVCLVILLACSLHVLTDPALTRVAPCDNVHYYEANYAQCDNQSNDYAPWYWMYHSHYYTYVNDDMDNPVYHPRTWYTSPTFYTTRYYRSGNGGSRISNYHVNTSPAHAKFGGGGRSGGTHGGFGGGGRGSSGSSSHGSGGSHSSGGSHGGFGGGGHGK